ncbi:MAG: DUF1660 family phage protein [Dermatophilaceae bacterium]|mgnify:CR=1 FL=1
MDMSEVLCAVVGHKWKKTQVRENRVTEMVCQRCGDVSDNPDVGLGPGTGHGGGESGFAAGMSDLGGGGGIT